MGSCHQHPPSAYPENTSHSRSCCFSLLPVLPAPGSRCTDGSIHSCPHTPPTACPALPLLWQVPCRKRLPQSSRKKVEPEGTLEWAGAIISLLQSHSLYRAYLLSPLKGHAFPLEHTLDWEICHNKFSYCWQDYSLKNGFQPTLLIQIPIFTSVAEDSNAMNSDKSLCGCGISMGGLCQAGLSEYFQPFVKSLNPHNFIHRSYFIFHDVLLSICIKNWTNYRNTTAEKAWTARCQWTLWRSMLCSAESEVLSVWYFSHCKVYILQFATLLLQMQSLRFIAAF